MPRPPRGAAPLAVEDLGAALRGLVTFADQLHTSMDPETVEAAAAEIEAHTAREAAGEARETAEKAAERRRTGGVLRVVSDGCRVRPQWK